MQEQTAAPSSSTREVFYQVMVGLIASVWFINGLFCKVFRMVPRHQAIVAAILGHGHAVLVTTLIGVAETLVAFWIVSGYRSRSAAIFQVVIIAVMNIVEFFTVPGLLLWGRLNLLFAFLLIAIILYTEFVLRPPVQKVVN